jgi:hypothetical protein
MSAPSFDRVMEALDRAKCLPPHSDGRNNGRLQMMVRCPAHDDGGPSLSIKHDGDRTLVHCFAGCDTKRVVEVLGLAMGDLFDERRNTATQPPKPRKRKLRELDTAEMVRTRPRPSPSSSRASWWSG